MFVMVSIDDASGNNAQNHISGKKKLKNTKKILILKENLQHFSPRQELYTQK